MNELNPTPQEILNIQPFPQPNESPEPKKQSVGWVIFWLIGFTPWGWYLVWKTNWSSRVKIIVILITAALFIGLLIESELISSQIANTSIDTISLPM